MEAFPKCQSKIATLLFFPVCSPEHEVRRKRDDRNSYLAIFAERWKLVTALPFEVSDSLISLPCAAFMCTLLQSYRCSHNAYTPDFVRTYRGTLYITEKHTCFFSSALAEEKIAVSPKRSTGFA